MVRLLFFLSLFIISSSTILSGQANNGLKYYKIISDTLMNSSQRVHILALEKSKWKDFEVDIVYADSLSPTSSLGKSNFGLASINGGFFDMKNGNSVSFIEKWDRLISSDISNSTMLNGAFIIQKEGDIILEEAASDSFYLSSRAELSILKTGPLLLKNGEKTPIEETKFSVNRHPRSCICETKKEILFMVIDGRNPKAYGMSLFEVQDLLLRLNCDDAINLDGGGSTALWIRGKGVVNSPSDNTGERPVANAIVIKPK
jgi:exopolysaccharide biosynthesis protein